MTDSSQSRWICEQHPEKDWPHDDCAGPGALVFPPHDHEFDERGFCVTCRQTRDEAANPLYAIRGWR